jgi:methionyl-tRNA formyltransferase
MDSEPSPVSAAHIVVAGNNRPAVDVLDLLLDRLGNESLLCIAPAGGPRHGWQASLAEAATERGVRCLTPTDVNDTRTVAAVRHHAAALMLSVYYTQIFRAELLTAVRGPVLNFHPSLLPRHRGASPVVHAIADGDAVTGLSVHHVDLGVDTGRLVWQRDVEIDPEDTSVSLHAKLGTLVVAAAKALVDGWLSGDGLPAAFEQAGEANVHRSTDPPLNRLDLTQPRERVRNVVRALAPPLPGAFVELGGERVVLTRAMPVDAPRRPPGTIERTGDDQLLVWAGDGALLAGCSVAAI